MVTRLAPAPRRAPGSPFVSIVVPARNEELDIEVATTSKCALDDPEFEVVVVDDRSTDRTREILGRLQRDLTTLRVVDGVEPPDDWLGKPHAMDEGQRAARAQAPRDWLLFSDADVRFSSDLLARAFRRIENEHLDFLSVFPALEAEGFGERLMVPSIGNLAFCFLPGWLMNVPGARRFGGGAGVFNLIRRDLYDALGGHAAIRTSVADDVQLGRSARLAGGRTGIALALDSVRVRMYRGFWETVRGFTKNLYWGLLGNLPFALAILAIFLAENLLPWGVVAASLLGGGPSIGSRAFALAAAILVLTVAIRGAVHVRLGYPPGHVLLHPLWAVAVAGLFLRSTWVNGVLNRNVWRGRERDARRLTF